MPKASGGFSHVRQFRVELRFKDVAKKKEKTVSAKIKEALTFKKDDTGQHKWMSTQYLLCLSCPQSMTACDVSPCD